ncbi:DUF4344 domain-containing metallopeptidase [Kaistia dalseonensis]|uniref:Metallopeptidase n=1 Tax=Kaistia dalseonensis TaxID=410840 RepID=A0ABU0H0D8_9HYPH|nr:DUF4344 domain-containing metallopeptidase [Kaistia dalseonensis]MCX5493217.1 DUF4344 domain-containing metallopeptidase [Kaistia dalseonensis]MDQ0435772.1 hypothetical protein [Kaistia dalseonensis]
MFTRSRISWLRLSAVLAVGLVATAAQAAAPIVDIASPRELSDSDKAEIVDFVVGNAVFALYHQAGHMMMERYGIAAGNGESGADQFATVTLLEPRSGAGDQTLVDAIDSWHLSSHQTASANGIDVALPDRHALDGERTDAIICDMVGADPQGFSDVADASGLDSAARARCATSYQTVRSRWTDMLKPLRHVDGQAATTIAVTYDEPTDGESVEATILQDNRVLEEVADRLARDFALPSPPTVRAKSCGAVTSLYDAAHNELVLCYELSAYHSDLIIRDIENRN